MTFKAFFICLNLISPFNAFASFEESKAQEIILGIPSDDQERLEKFFRKLLFFQGFAYSLFGDKPVSIDCYDLENRKKDVFCTPSCGYRTFEKYAHLLPQKNYVFLFFEDKVDNLCEISLINKEAFRRVVDNHREEFAKVFGNEITSDELLSLLIQKRSLWNTPIKDRDDLIGILLGYGKVNAKLFQKRTEILRRKKGIKKKRTEPSSGYQSINEELKVLNTSLKSFSSEGKVSLHYMRLPSFAADLNDAETLLLKQKYREQRKQITKLYSNGKFLEITFNRICSQKEDN